MIIAIAGTPGTGKTQVAESLHRKMNIPLIKINELVEKGKVHFKIDKDRNTKIVEAHEINSYLEDDAIVEGMVAHLLKVDVIIILRCDPDVLKTRLKRRQWSKRKINENIQAEILDEITLMSENKNIYEIDTSNRKADTTANVARRIVSAVDKNNKVFLAKYKPGKINWSSSHVSELLKPIDIKPLSHFKIKRKKHKLKVRGVK